MYYKDNIDKLLHTYVKQHRFVKFFGQRIACLHRVHVRVIFHLSKLLYFKDKKREYTRVYIFYFFIFCKTAFIKCKITFSQGCIPININC